MIRIIRVIYNPASIENGIVIQKHRDYFTNTDTLEEAVQSVRVEADKLMDIIGGQIVSVEQFTDIKI